MYTAIMYQIPSVNSLLDFSLNTSVVREVEIEECVLEGQDGCGV